MAKTNRRNSMMSSTEERIHDAAMRLFAERGVTEVTVSELAEAAGVARGTVYNRKGDIGALFEEVATRLADEMMSRVDATMRNIDDPARRIATGLRLFVRRAHEDPAWGRFLARFGGTAPTLKAMLAAGPSKDLQQCVRERRVVLRRDQITPALAMLSASSIGAILLVLNGNQTWREAGSTMAELFLRALGVSPEEARAISEEELPQLEAEDP